MQAAFPRSPFPSLCAVALVALFSCGKDEPVRVYEVIVPPAAQAKPGQSPGMMPDSAAQGAAAAATARAPEAAARVTYSVPDNWEPQPLPPMVNRGSFLLPEWAGARPALTISSFPGSVGGLPANLNRWRRQLALPELPDAEVVAATQQRALGTHFLVVCQYDGTGKDGSPSSTAGAILALPGESWFFKLTAPKDAMAASRAAFDAFLGTIRVAEGPAQETAPSTPAPAPAAKPAYTVPASWREMEAGGMRAASFSIAGPDSLNADVSVVKMAGNAGGDLQNVNLWRQQLGLPETTAADLPGQLREEAIGPARWKIFDAGSEGKILQNAYRGRILAAMLAAGDATWVVRIRGEYQQLEQEQENFHAFLASLKLP